MGRAAPRGRGVGVTAAGLVVWTGLASTMPELEKSTGASMGTALTGVASTGAAMGETSSGAAMGDASIGAAMGDVSKGAAMGEAPTRAVSVGADTTGAAGKVKALISAAGADEDVGSRPTLLDAEFSKAVPIIPAPPSVGAMTGADVLPSSTAGADVPPSGTAGTDVLPSGTAGANVPPSGAGTDVLPSGTAGTDVLPSGTAGTDVLPSGTAGTDVLPSGMAGDDVLPSGMAGATAEIPGRAFADTAGLVSAAGTAAICAFMVRRSIAPTTRDFILGSLQ